MSNTALARVPELRERIRQLEAPALDTRTLPTHPVIGRLLPGGALKEGATYSVDRSLTLLMLLLAAPSAAGAWCGVVGVPEFGVEAAAGIGIDLERLVLVPEPGEQWLVATAAIADALKVIALRPPGRPSDKSIARLSARLRKRGATLLVLGTAPRGTDSYGTESHSTDSYGTGPYSTDSYSTDSYSTGPYGTGSHSMWPNSEATLSITESAWTGVGSGHGHLQSRDATITVASRTGGRPRSARLRLPGD